MLGGRLRAGGNLWKYGPYAILSAAQLASVGVFRSELVIGRRRASAIQYLARAGDSDSPSSLLLSIAGAEAVDCPTRSPAMAGGAGYLGVRPDGGAAPTAFGGDWDGLAFTVTWASKGNRAG